MTPAEARVELLRYLKAVDYQFVAVTPATHARILARPAPKNPGLRDVFGWNRTFAPADVAPAVLALLQAADALDEQEQGWISRIRVASVGDELVLHSAYPTDAPDAVFFGPDTYRFARFLQQRLPLLGPRTWLVDMGAGSGAGAIAAARLQSFGRITLVDTNEAALQLASANSAVASVPAETLLSDTMPVGADLIIANPPYMMDAAGRSYRDGGGLLGGEVALDWVKQAIACMAPAGAMLLYTGAAYVAGEAPLLDSLASACAEADAALEVEELDPDVFGEELDQPGYEQVERIAAIGALIQTPQHREQRCTDGRR